MEVVDVAARAISARPYRFRRHHRASPHVTPPLQHQAQPKRQRSAQRAVLQTHQLKGRVQPRQQVDHQGLLLGGGAVLRGVREDTLDVQPDI